MRLKLLTGLVVISTFITTNCFLKTKSTKEYDVPKEFNYPESPEIIEFEKPFVFKALNGTITDNVGFPIPKVLVELVKADWKSRIKATLTDEQGKFILDESSPGINYIKISKDGFNTIFVKIIVDKKSKDTFKIKMGIST